MSLKYRDKKTPMTTTWIIVPYFCKAKLMIDYLKYLRALNLPSEKFSIVIVNDHYPIDIPEQDIVRDLATFFWFKWVDCGKNLGMQSAINYALKEVNALPEDVVILSDPDDYPSPDAYEALVEVIQDETIAIAALGFKQIEENRKKLNPFPSTAIISARFDEQGLKNCHTHNHWIHPTVDLWHIAAYRMEWINSIGGFGQAYPYWGGLESYMFERFNGKKLVYLTDYTCTELDKTDPELFDPEFREYKNDIHLNQFKQSFSEWLTLKNKSIGI